MFKREKNIKERKKEKGNNFEYICLNGRKILKKERKRKQP